MRVVLGLLQKGMWRIKMKTKLKAVQILEVMLNKNRKVRVFSESDNTVFDGEDWVSIDEAITELKGYIQNSNREIQSLKDKLFYADLVLREHIDE